MACSENEYMMGCPAADPSLEPEPSLSGPGPVQGKGLLFS